MTTEELVRAMGHPHTLAKGWCAMEEDTVRERIRTTIGVQGARAIIGSIWDALRRSPRDSPRSAPPVAALVGIPRAEWPRKERVHQNPVCNIGYALNKWTTIPLPSKESWASACKKDPDIKRIIAHLNGTSLLTRDRLSHTGYWRMLEQNRLVVEGETLFCTEECQNIRVRQLKTRVVPMAMRRLVFAACHVSPMAGHTGMHKTFWRIAVRFWWPGMVYQIEQWVLSCGFCRVGNIESHSDSAPMHAFSSSHPLRCGVFGCLDPRQHPK